MEFNLGYYIIFFFVEEDFFGVVEVGVLFGWIDFGCFWECGFFLLGWIFCFGKWIVGGFLCE